MTAYYILDVDHIPQPVDVIQWSEWILNQETDRIVGSEFAIPGVHVSTVFFGIDYSLPLIPHSPMMFETKVFGCCNDGYDGYQKRYRTWAGAAAGHKFICSQIKQGINLISW